MSKAGSDTKATAIAAASTTASTAPVTPPVVAAAAAAAVYYEFAPHIESDKKAVARAKELLASAPETNVLVVGTSNPTKLSAAQRAFPHLVVIGFDVESGVGQQPVGTTQTRDGALTRARNAQLKFPRAAFWLGIENGMWQSARSTTAKSVDTNSTAAASAVAATAAAVATVESYNAGFAHALAASKKPPQHKKWFGWVDAAALVLVSRIGDSVLSGWSDAIPLPAHWVECALTARPDGIPVMYSRFAKEWTNDSPDAHHLLSGGLRGRASMLEDGLRALTTTAFAGLKPNATAAVAATPATAATATATAAVVSSSAAAAAQS